MIFLAPGTMSRTTLAFSRPALHVVAEALHPDRVRREEAVAEGGLARGNGVRLERDDHRLVIVGAERGGDGAQRSHPGQPAIAPLHGFRPVEPPGDYLRQQGREDVRGVGALLVDMRDIELALLGIGLDPGLIDRTQPRRLEEAVDCLLWRADPRALALFAHVRRSAGTPYTVSASRRGVANAFAPSSTRPASTSLSVTLPLNPPPPAPACARESPPKQFDEEFGHYPSVLWLLVAHRPARRSRLQARNRASSAWCRTPEFHRREAACPCVRAGAERPNLLCEPAQHGCTCQ